MTDPLDTLRPEVRDALMHIRPSAHRFEINSWNCVRAELLRLAAIEADALIALDCEHDWQVEHKRAEKAEAELVDLKVKYTRLNEVCENTVRCLREQDDEADRNEAELAALKARIAEAPEYRCEADIISGRDGDYISAVLIHDDNAFQYPDVDGKRVRLLVEDDK